MERLTEKIVNIDSGSVLAYRLRSAGDRIKADRKLGKYEDAEEQGLLLRLPCKVGDTILKIPSKVNYDLNIVNKHEENNRVYEQKVHSIQMWNNNSYILNTCEGKEGVRSETFKETWFLNREEAETALAELKTN